ncbi:MAG TPA: S8 family serine peptidase [Candidatus Kapabacteria bacterium]|nr:S8 family serine peptidase [Candidatus Kapabacteria bacterium]
MTFSLRPLIPLLLVLLASRAMLAGDGAQARGSVAARTAASPHYLAGTIIVKLAPGVPNLRRNVRFELPALDAILDRSGIISRRALLPMAQYPEVEQQSGPQEHLTTGFDRIYVITYSGPYDPIALGTEIRATGLVEFAEPYYTFPLAYTPNDPLLGQQSWLTIIHTQEAWDITKGDSTVAIGIVDTGVDWPHEDLGPNIWINPGESGLDGQGKDKRTNGIDDDNDGFVDDYHGWDFVGNPTLNELQGGAFHPDNDPSPRPNNVAGYEGYHGTTVAGCASARGDNGKGVAGIGFLTRLIGVKCAADSIGTNSVVAGYDGIRFAADMGARVINCSWGGPSDPSTVAAMQAVVDYAYTKGALVVAASGNAGTNNDLAPSFPANLRHVLSVGATTPQDSAANFSEYGVSVGVWAPGTDIYTTTPGNGYGSSINGESISGTSFASPIVSGIAGLVTARHKDWTPDQVAMQIRVTGDRVRVRTPSLAPYFYRRANAYRAVALNTTLAPGDPTGVPGVAIDSYSINGKSSDTIRDVNQNVTVRLTLKNLLSPVSNLTVEAVAGQTLSLTTPVTIASIGTLQTTVQDLHVKMVPNSGVLYSEGDLQLVLKLSASNYEDYVVVRIPVRLPGWHLQYDALAAGSLQQIVGAGLCAVKPTLAWTVSNVSTSQTTETPIVARSLDGLSWSAFQQVATNGDALYCITALDDKHAWAGSGPTSGQAAIFRTTTGPSSWQRTSVATITPFVDAIYFFDNQNGIFVGDPLNGKWGIGVTTNAGTSWAPLASALTAGTSTEAGWNNSFTAVGDTLWFGTNNSRIYRSVDRGRTWTFGTTPSANSFGIAFCTGNDGLATFAPLSTGSGSYMVAASRDGGKTWRAAQLPFSGAQVSGVTFEPGTTRAFVGTQNGVYETSDFGATWKQMAVPPILFSGTYFSTAADANGHVTSFSTNAYTQLEFYRDSVAPTPLAVPDVRNVAATNSLAMLGQNVPNPCSHSTTIPFELRTAGRVRLVMYDALGLQVMNLFDGMMDRGEHRVDAAVDHLAPGAYYYSLETGGQTLARRLLIVR